MLKHYYIVLIILFGLFCYFSWSAFSQVAFDAEITISGAWVIIWTPSNLVLWTIDSWDNIETSFADNFWIEDLRWTTTWHYTTIQIDGLYGPNNTVVTWLQLSWDNINLIGGLANNTLIYPNFNSWTDITLPRLYLFRTDDNLYNWALNRYWNNPTLKINIPTWVPSGYYSGEITYTLYDMSFNY